MLLGNEFSVITLLSLNKYLLCGYANKIELEKRICLSTRIWLLMRSVCFVGCIMELEITCDLFFDRDNIYKLWDSILRWQKLQGCSRGWNAIWLWINQLARSKHPRELILKASLTTTMYTIIWIKRNTRDFSTAEHINRWFSSSNANWYVYSS